MIRTWFGQRETMSIDQEIQQHSPQEIDRTPVRGKGVVHLLSTALIVAGVALAAAGGLKAYLTMAVVPEPPPPVGLADSAALPSLEENPLLVFSEESSTRSMQAGNLAAAASEARPVSLAAPGGSVAAAEPDRSEAMQQAEREARSDLPLAPTPDPPPPATQPPTRIVAPSIQLDSKVVPVGWKQAAEGGKIVTVWEVAEYAAGWHKNSALPGDGGNIVLSGHHNTKGEVFRYIVGLDVGDTVTLYADDRPYTYTVESRFVLRDKGASEEQRRQNAQWIGPFPEERLTLVTCWPYTNNTHRVIVIAKPEK